MMLLINKKEEQPILRKGVFMSTINSLVEQTLDTKNKKELTKFTNSGASTGANIGSIVGAATGAGVGAIAYGGKKLANKFIDTTKRNNDTKSK